ncbi:centriole, cilia and spindle-associated protein [Lampris incognitus]|uniref:centriole, cilia and spindle-associated protein n=1 Tax=Lampris incognitus TaxID=2546036 RepID=UPI0024B55CDE|nr:centriole, cilia and spindle-associated protein [Lampris incognitus]
MLTKRIRTEYMKKFKDPKWETYTKCYEEMLRYRLTRRLLEHTHNPWIWTGSDSDSDSGGGSPLPNMNQVISGTTKDGTEAEYEECAGERTDQQQRLSVSKTAGLIPKMALTDDREYLSPQISTVTGAHKEGAGVTKAPEEEKEKELGGEQKATSRGSKQPKLPQKERHQERDPRTLHQQQTKPSKSSKPSRRIPRTRPAPLQKPREDKKENRHPFALYGWGDRHAEVASKKTHNVGPAASTNEIHESALRAKTRREVEHQIQTERAERRRAKSAHVDKNRTRRTQPDFNPWLTEYMRCFSVRSR